MSIGFRTLEEDLLQAVEYIENDNYRDALPLLTRVVSFEPANATAHELWVMCHIHVGRLERAVELCDNGVARGLSPLTLTLEKSTALRLLERYDEAIAAAMIAATIDRTSPRPMRALAVAQLASGDNDAALQTYQTAAMRWPYDAAIRFELLDLAAELERHDLVIDNARAYLRVFEKDPDVLNMLGHAYAASGDFRHADKAFRDAARIDPDEPELHVNVLMVAAVSGNHQSFTSYMDRLAARDPELAALVASRAKLSLQDSRRRNAVGGSPTESAPTDSTPTRADQSHCEWQP
jgi:Flp pilus assembly protein TadD